MTENEKAILQECVLKAIQFLDKNPWESRYNIRKGGLLYKGKLYPTKLILGNIIDQINNDKLDVPTPRLSGGEPIFKYLEKLDFIIERKNDFSSIIAAYKKHIQETHLEHEIYKWKLISEFSGRPNTDALDFYEEIKIVKYKNLVYQMAIPVLHHLAKVKPDEMRALFKMLFDEKIDLSSRLNTFNTKSLEIYRGIGETLGHHQDERTISSYLTLHNPKKYTFYKSSFYKKLCNFLDVKAAKKNEKYAHYLELLNKIVQDYIQDDEELKSLVKSFVPEQYDGDNLLLLAQDILYQMFDLSSDDTLSDNEEVEVGDEIIKEIKSMDLNQILYGPPGTGKTFKLQDEFFDKFTVKETSLTREQFLETKVADLTWWQVISIAVLDIGKAKVNDIFNHEFIRLKEKLSSSKTVRPTIWGQLQSHTIMDCKYVNVSNRSEPLFFNKNENSEWTIDKELIIQYYPEAIELLEISKNYNPKNDSEIKNFEFVTFHQSFSYEDFIEGIKPKLEDGESDLSYEIKDGVFKKLCLRAEADPNSNFAIFIDEINRGNVSAIFGELITLIESDKRLGAENELRIKLPYSKTDFGVPSNLYIIGTMNTADRSVEALDTALRRRFSFTEIMPEPELLNKILFSGFNLQEVLEAINDRIEVLLDRDHTIGHSYFLKLNSNDTGELRAAFQNAIIPLLQEYFYHDYEKIALILGSGFVEIKDNKSIKFASFNGLGKPEIGNQFELLKEIGDIEQAVKLLLNKND
ncbi:McrB family protein [Flavobacterium sp. 14A]|uniref:McrB family protein n=1 Tax=Flavobacterium sp. 14A TaxID=2735896 RepID=UPI0015713159|nr:AAA family ATPase [Flavobacterium sp. 14A]NRT10468.1 hypothetical protein [Flavobacterium sp. 14A]